MNAACAPCRGIIKPRYISTKMPDLSLAASASGRARRSRNRGVAAHRRAVSIEEAFRTAAS